MNATITRTPGVALTSTTGVDATVAEQKLIADIVGILKKGRGAGGELPYTETVMQLVELIGAGRAAVEGQTATTSTLTPKIAAQAKAIVDLALATELKPQQYIGTSSSKRALSAGRAALNDLAALLPKPSHARDLVMRGLKEAGSQPVTWFENLILRGEGGQEDLASRVERHSLHRTLNTLRSLLGAQGTPEQLALTLLSDCAKDLPQLLGNSHADPIVARKLVEDARKVLVEVGQALHWSSPARKSIEANLQAGANEDINGEARSMAYTLKAATALLTAGSTG